MAGMVRGTMHALAIVACLMAPGPLRPEDDTVIVTDEKQRRHREIDRAVDKGLAFLANQQLPCGGWAGSVGHKQEDDYVVFDSASAQVAADRGHMGVSALAGIAFLASGRNPDRGEHARTLGRAIDYVVGHMDEFGYLSDSGSRMYSHAFGTLFLAEVEGMTRTRKDAVHLALHKAASFIMSTQNAYGAWRYSPFTVEADLSVTVCQVQALRAARDVGVFVPASTIDRVVDYVKRSRIEDDEDYAGAFYYKIYGTAAYSRTSYAINAAAVTTLHSAGVYDESKYGRAVRFLEEEYDTISRHYGSHFYYWYGNYYALQAMHHVGGERFERFFDRVADDLLASQESDGRWKNDVGPGDAFSTAVACILLRIPDAYLPILQR